MNKSSDQLNREELLLQGDWGRKNLEEKLNDMWRIVDDLKHKVNEERELLEKEKEENNILIKEHDRITQTSSVFHLPYYPKNSIEPYSIHHCVSEHSLLSLNRSQVNDSLNEEPVRIRSSMQHLPNCPVRSAESCPIHPPKSLQTAPLQTKPDLISPEEKEEDLFQEVNNLKYAELFRRLRTQEENEKNREEDLFEVGSLRDPASAGVPFGSTDIFTQKMANRWMSRPKTQPPTSASKSLQKEKGDNSLSYAAPHGVNQS